MHKILLLGVGSAINLAAISIPMWVVSDHLSEVLSNPTMWIFYCLVTLFCILESNASFALEDQYQHKPETTYAPYLTGFFILMILWFSVYDFANNPHQNITRITVAGILVSSGIFLRVISIKTLGQLFTSHIGLIRNHRLVTTGVYSFVRHPSEAGMLLIGFGVPILLSSSTGLWAAIILLTPMSIYRMSLEDHVLSARFSKDFLDYKSATPSLLPGITGLLRPKVPL